MRSCHDEMTLCEEDTRGGPKSSKSHKILQAEYHNNPDVGMDAVSIF